MTAVAENAGKLANSVGLMMVRKVLGSVLSALSSVMVVRSLSPDHFGQYAAGLAAFYLLMALTEFGFGEVLGRSLGRSEGGASVLGRLVLRVNLLWSAGVAVAGVVVAGFFAYGTIRSSTLLVMTPALALAGTSALRQFFYARHQVGRMAAIDLSTSVASTVVIVALAVLDAPAVSMAAAASAAAAANSLLVWRAARHWLVIDGDPDQDIGRPSAEVLFRESYPIGVASFLATAYVSIDVVILSGLFTADVVGQYASAVKVLSILTIFPGLVMSVALPQLSADWEDVSRFGDLLARMWHWFMSLVMPGLVIVAANATGVMTLLFGDAYAPAGSYLRILMLAGFVSMFCQLLGVVIVAAARAKWLIVQNVIALVINVGGNLVIAPRFGIESSAWLTVLTEIIVCGGSWLVLRDRIPYGALLKVSLLPVVAAAAAVAAGLAFTSEPLISLPLSGVVFVVVLTLVRGWPSELVRMLPRSVKAT
ncbi:oligosaccharide flippase family protein [Actinoplanes sp. TFC3]|uniref:oligosaccharide flippase family protein n=1 Tax=Actinoplanes sp. TFC3 TaxID=1710355 RepID=UPI0008352CB4|nr:oligosaccharide flippase family protein [Actinoplanes sp. TFC3]